MVSDIRNLCSKKTLLGFSAAALSLSSYEASTIAVQALQRAIPDFELSMIRYTGIVVVSAIWIILRKKSFNLNQQFYGPVLTLGFTSFIANTTYFYAVAILPLAHSSALFTSVKTVFFALLTRMIRHTPVKAITVVSLVGCTIGMILLIQPWKPFTNGFIPGFLDNTQTTETLITAFPSNESMNLMHESNSRDKFLYLMNWKQVVIGYVLIILAGAVDSIAVYALSFLLKTCEPGMQAFAAGFVALVISVVTMFYMEQPVVSTNGLTILLASIHGIMSGIVLVSYAISVLYIEPMQVAILYNLDSTLILIPQYTYMSRHLSGRMNIMEVLGCIFVTLFSTVGSVVSSGDFHEDL